MKYLFKSGASVEGTIDQIMVVAKSLGETVDLGKLGTLPRGYYNSESKGYLKISDMPTPHIRSALLKKSREHFEKMNARTSVTNAEFCKQYMSLSDNPIVEDLFTELAKRK